jgi:TonB family protein
MSLRAHHRWAIVLTTLLGAAAATVIGQDSLTRAKDFYASADYEEALQVLDKLHSSPAGDSTEVAAYQVFCLVALGRSDEATRAITSIVKMDPLYRPSDSQVSPRVRQFYENVRRPLLSDVVRDAYNKGKDAFAKKDMPAANQEFDEVIALVDEMGPESDAGLADLRTLASGFRDLSKAADTPPPPPAPTPTPAPTATATPSDSPASSPADSRAASGSSATSAADTARVYSASDSDVVKPIALAQMMPAWNPANPVDKVRDFRGTLEVTIDETGRVSSARMTRSVNAVYDPLLVKAALQWQYRPATRAGVVVRYRYALDIHLGR